MPATREVDLTPSPTSPTSRSRLSNILVVALIVILTPIIVYVTVTVLIGPPRLGGPALPEIPPPGAAESVIIPFANVEPIATAGTYSGEVRLVIEGFGNLTDGSFADAFYRYAADDGFSLDEPELKTMRVLLDGEDISGELALPRYNPFHLYDLSLSVGDSPQALAFLIEEGDPSDDEGRLVVYIVPGGDE